MTEEQLNELKIVDPDAWYKELENKQQAQKLDFLDKKLKSKFGVTLEESQYKLPHSEYVKLISSPVVDLSEFSTYFNNETTNSETKSETKSEETKSEETKSEETKSEETKSETKSEETKSEETKSEETKSEDNLQFFNIGDIPEENTLQVKESIVDKYKKVTF